ncbi:hypothetical protein JRO89_XS03G0092700 [Xanthoceras sorbifolium]|uniref:RNase H type-1 domain-containing protein n=1 Tax=Xanthoceras sorbifolium TaxID=99658 RepID=A0ABQ8I996_9ROSI|nr:hypothetical protein JRO89_XS03G0092700 [Xanthoceras sorbifolium]
MIDLKQKRLEGLLECARDLGLGDIIRSLERDLESLWANDELYWKQMSTMEWLAAGDRNLRFFHMFASTRKKKNWFVGLTNEAGRRHFSGDGIVHTIQRYFSDLISSINPSAEDLLGYEMKNGYKRALKEKLRESCSDSSLDKKWWGMSCSLNLPLKIKFFIWKVGHKVILNLCNLAKRKVVVKERIELFRGIPCYDVLRGLFSFLSKNELEWVCMVLWGIRGAHKVGAAAWSRPPSGMLKLNSDIAIKPCKNIVGVGAAIRDSSRLVVAVVSKTLVGSFSAKFGEFLALHEGLLLARNLGLSVHLIEVDACNVVSSVLGSNSCYGENGLVILDTKALLHDVGFLKCEAISRTSNGVAYNLAFLVLSSLEESATEKESPATDIEMRHNDARLDTPRKMHMHNTILTQHASKLDAYVATEAIGPCESGLSSSLVIDSFGKISTWKRRARGFYDISNVVMKDLALRKRMVVQEENSTYENKLAEVGLTAEVSALHALHDQETCQASNRRSQPYNAASALHEVYQQQLLS